MTQTSDAHKQISTPSFSWHLGRTASAFLLPALLLPTLLLAGSGCLSLFSALHSSADEAKNVARFDTGCRNAHVVARYGDRIKLHGCGQEMIYDCSRETTYYAHRSHPRTRPGKVAAVIDALLIGPSVTDTRCALVASRALRAIPPRPVPDERAWPPGDPAATPLATSGDDTRPTPAPDPKRRAIAGARATDDPGVRLLARRDRATSRVARMPPSSKHGTVDLSHALRACAALRGTSKVVAATVHLHVRANGDVDRATVRAPSLTKTTRVCLARAFTSTHLAAPGHEVTLRYPVTLR